VAQLAQGVVVRRSAGAADLALGAVARPGLDVVAVRLVVARIPWSSGVTRRPVVAPGPR